MLCVLAFSSLVRHAFQSSLLRSVRLDEVKEALGAEVLFSR